MGHCVHALAEEQSEEALRGSASARTTAAGVPDQIHRPRCRILATASRGATMRRPRAVSLRRGGRPRFEFRGSHRGLHLRPKDRRDPREDPVAATSSSIACCRSRSPGPPPDGRSHPASTLRRRWCASSRAARTGSPGRTSRDRRHRDARVRGNVRLVSAALPAAFIAREAALVEGHGPHRAIARVQHPSVIEGQRNEDQDGDDQPRRARGPSATIIPIASPTRARRAHEMRSWSASPWATTARRATSRSR